MEALIQNGAMDNKPKFNQAIDDIQIEYRKQIKIDRLKEKPHIPLSLNNKFDIPLPNIEDIVHSLGGKSKDFTKLDLAKGFW